MDEAPQPKSSPRRLRTCNAFRTNVLAWRRRAVLSPTTPRSGRPVTFPLAHRLAASRQPSRRWTLFGNGVRMVSA